MRDRASKTSSLCEQQQQSTMNASTLIPVLIAIFFSFGAMAYFVSKRRFASRVGPIAKGRALNVVLVGATRGIGLALASEFVRRGDRVVIAGRHDVDATVTDLKQLTTAQDAVFGFACDVREGERLRLLGRFANQSFGAAGIDLWINVAAQSHSMRDFLFNVPDDAIANVVNTNLLGTLLSAKAALISNAKCVFLFDGAGTDGMTTPRFLTYGSTKAGLIQTMKTLNAELKLAGRAPCVNLVQPGMVLTDLLLRSRSTVEPELRHVFNILCETPDTVAAWLAPRLQAACRRGASGAHIRFLTKLGVVGRFLTSRWRRNRLINEATGEFVTKSKVQ
jgi:chlorophyll(ide) b reductase